MRDLKKPLTPELVERWNRFSHTKAHKKARFKKIIMRMFK